MPNAESREVSTMSRQTCQLSLRRPAAESVNYVATLDKVFLILAAIGGRRTINRGDYQGNAGRVVVIDDMRHANSPVELDEQSPISSEEEILMSAP